MSAATVHLDRLLEPLAASFSPDVAAKVAALRSLVRRRAEALEL